MRKDTVNPRAHVAPSWESRERFRSLAENSPVAILIMNTEFRISYANDEAASISGFPREELIGRDFLEFVDAKSLPLVTYYNNCRKHGDYAPSCYEFTFARKDGERRVVECRASVIKDSRGNAETVLQLLDITTRLQAEEELKSSHEIFQIIFEYAPDSIYLNDPKGDFINGNRMAEQLTGYTKEELIGKNFLTLGLLPLNQIPKAVGLMAKSVAGKPSGPDELVLKRRDGTLIPLEISTFPVKVNGKTIAMGIARDISERKLAEKALQESEEKFRNISESAHEAILTVDLDGSISYMNKAAEKTFGYSVAEAIGKDLAGLLAPESSRAAYQEAFGRFKKIGRGPAAGKMLETEAVRKDGTIIPIEVSLSVITLNDENKMIGIFRDITDRKRAEEELAKHRENLETLVRERTKELEDAKQAADAANGAKSTFLAHMSHEIRTPINAIMGFSQLMQRDDTLAPQQRLHLDVINRSGEHLLAVITDILEMSKIEAGRITLNPTTFSLLALLEELELMFRLRTDAKKLSFAMEGLGDIPRYVEGDEGKMRQILINLLGNAVKFTENGGVVLRIRTHHEEAGGLRLEAEVEDTGPGIPEDEQGDLFKPFQQTQSGRRMMSGTGLGLAICKEFVNLMGGEISVVSKVGKGSLFKFHVRLGEGDVGFAEKKPESHRVKRLKDGQPERRILIADDDELNCAFLSKLLGDVGFATRQVTNGKEAIEEFLAWRPHLILMDMRMPEMNGCEAARRIRASDGGADVKIVGVSASAFEENRREALEAGADDFLTKPFREVVLFAKIEKLLGVEYELSEKSAAEKDLARASGPCALTAGALEALPADFIKRMREAVVQADYDRMMGLIDAIDGHGDPVAEGLRGLVERFEYNKLFELLQPERSD